MKTNFAHDGSAAPKKSLGWAARTAEAPDTAPEQQSPADVVWTSL
jgi:hypothetical protein